MKNDLEAALQRAIDNLAGHNEVLAEFDRLAAPLPSAPALNNIWTRLPFWAAAWPAREPATFHRLVVDDDLEHIADLAPKEIRHRESLAIEVWNGGAETGAQDADPDTIDVLEEQHRLETVTDLSKNDQPTGPTSDASWHRHDERTQRPRYI